MNNNDIFKKMSEMKLNEKPDSESVNKLLSGLDRKSADKIREILKDPEKTNQLMNSPGAQALIKKLRGGNGNG